MNAPVGLGVKTLSNMRHYSYILICLWLHICAVVIIK